MPWVRAMRFIGSTLLPAKVEAATARLRGGRTGHSASVRLTRPVLTRIGIEPLRDRVGLSFIGPIARLRRVPAPLRLAELLNTAFLGLDGPVHQAPDTTSEQT